MQVFESIADAIGNTPLVKISRVLVPAPHTLLAKCEFMNPGGSVKDRIAFHMVRRAEQRGLLTRGMQIVEATGGNTGIGLALAARLGGYELLCVMTEKVGKEKVRMMQVLGAETLVVPGGKPISDPEHFINKAKRIAADRGAWFVGQFENTDNLDAHYETTGPEIWAQSHGEVDALVAGIGTGGTLLGAGRFLKERKPSVKLVLADPEGSCLGSWQAGTEPKAGSYIIEGIGGDFVPTIVDLKSIDESFTVSDRDAVQMAYELLSKEALFVGGSSGLIVSAAIEFLKRAPSSTPLSAVAILPSAGRLYMSTIFDQEWLSAKGLA